MGLGRYPDVTLGEARRNADIWRAHVRQGRDAIKERDRQRRSEARRLHLLEDIAPDAFEARKAELKGDGKAGRWFTPLKLHVLPKLGKVPVSEITQIDIRDALSPIWHAKAETARKALNRLGICLNYAAALGLDVDIQATQKARALLGQQRHVPKHIPAMHWSVVPSFYQSLDEGSSVHLALRLALLTAVRSKPIRYIHLDQIDGDIWIVPANVMKGRKGKTSEFRVPLSSEAQAIIEQARPLERLGFLFPGRESIVISDMSMSELMKRRGLIERPHGFRSSFRDWVAETQNVSHEIADTCLGHVVGGAVERAYRRTDFLEQRRPIMERWAAWVAGGSQASRNKNYTEEPCNV